MGILLLWGLGVLCGEGTTGACGSTHDDGAAEFAGGHHARFGGGIDHCIERQHGEVEGHDLDDRAQSVEGCANAEADKTELCDGGVDDALVAELVERKSV